MINIKSIIIGTANFFQGYGINNSLINNKEKNQSNEKEFYGSWYFNSII